jgi:holo-[acyl-carrier protein] synthase
MEAAATAATIAKRTGAMVQRRPGRSRSRDLATTQPVSYGRPMLKWRAAGADGAAMNAISAAAVPSAPKASVLRRLRRRTRNQREVRAGIDLVEIAAVAATLDSPLSARYLARIYTPAEVRDCTDANGVNAARLAARFAAKEAVLKALDVGNRAIPWRTIEVQRLPSGRPTISLHGAAAAIACQEGVARFALSLSHEARYASALVVASS